MDDETVERVRAVVLAIPPGETLSYGEVARLAGCARPGWWAASSRSTATTCRGTGCCAPTAPRAPHIAPEQHERLRAEGVFLAPARRRGRAEETVARSSRDAPDDR